MRLSGGVEDWNPKAAGWLEMKQINLDADILVAKGTGARSTLAWYQNLTPNARGNLQFRSIRSSTN